MARTATTIPTKIAARIERAAQRNRTADEAARRAREELRALLLDARADGYPLRALAELIDLSPTQTYNLTSKESN